ncbi:hypothetical protein CC86DRAFT_388155 [Ophiobolus disseminans]|uniref:Uncharacterized protein n=1 Tax=Ophiobolus disseminans TaxID=1469910 RepID=A0A6A6ZED5_9PLEO|nr:hypothetical protein CC86DRAFT_388155 [Ophiobolus disseminans]
MDGPYLTFTTDEFIAAAQALSEESKDGSYNVSDPVHSTFDGMIKQLRDRTPVINDWLADNALRDLEPKLIEQILDWPSASMAVDTEYGACDPDQNSEKEFDDTGSDSYWPDDTIEDILEILATPDKSEPVTPENDFMTQIIESEKLKSLSFTIHEMATACVQNGPYVNKIHDWPTFSNMIQEPKTLGFSLQKYLEAKDALYMLNSAFIQGYLDAEATGYYNNEAAVKAEKYIAAINSGAVEMDAWESFPADEPAGMSDEAFNAIIER